MFILRSDLENIGKYEEQHFSRKTKCRDHLGDGDLDLNLIAMWMLIHVGCKIGDRLHDTLDSP